MVWTTDQLRLLDEMPGDGTEMRI